MTFALKEHKDIPLRISAPHFVVGVVHDGRNIIRTAPIVSYMLGWRIEQVLDYCKKKHWNAEALS